MAAEKVHVVDRGVTQGNLHVDPEWVELMKEARNMGLSKEQIRGFIWTQTNSK